MVSKFKKLSLLLILGLLSFNFVSAQIIGGDDDDFGKTEVTIKEDIKIVVNKEQIMWRDEINFDTDLKLNTKIDYLKPNSWVIIQIKKTGVKLKTVKFQANELGELELEATTPKKQIGATANVEYYSSAGKKYNRKLRIKFLKDKKK